MTKLLTTAGLIYNKVIWNDYPVGTPFEMAEPTTGHLQARVMTGGTPSTSRYVKLAGSDNSDNEVMYVHTYEYLNVFDTVHPNCPSLTGPFIGRYDGVSIDRLPANVLAQVNYCVNYPFVEYNVCINDLYMKWGEDAALEQIGSGSLPTDLKVRVPKSVKEISKKVVECNLDQWIDVTFKDFEVIEDPNW